MEAVTDHGMQPEIKLDRHTGIKRFKTPKIRLTLHFMAALVGTMVGYWAMTAWIFAFA